MAAAASNTYSIQKLEPFYQGQPPEEYNITLATGTYARGLVLGEVTATPGTFKAYASASIDGSQTPKAILAYDVTVDASGNAQIGAGGVGGIGTAYKGVPAYFSGQFRCEELTGLDATALTNSTRWKVVQGSVTAGVLEI